MNVKHDLNKLSQDRIERVHIDIMDGNFVPNLAFTPEFVKRLNETTSFFLDCHLMVENPEKWVDHFEKSGADLITIHVESTPHIHRVLQQIKETGKKVGIAVNPGTTLQSIAWLFPLVDQVLIMTVNPGFGGQKFIFEMVGKIKELNKLKKHFNYKFDIEVDGGINVKTGRLCLDAGANILVAGSYVFSGESISEQINNLRQLV
ncbi:ribulose-5-phosphate 3-epimerase [Liquorilactobacillus mali]|uniref:Ribulose-phosphate 3-epimerase n=2 Tax=Liquorilactobacillus mali TaxID=1618 RepID=A0A0R2FNF9_9LACO|nr:ribulose-5-phosphate 3-epimerase [Liquorilactobacillus mali]